MKCTDLKCLTTGKETNQLPNQPTNPHTYRFNNERSIVYKN